MLSKSAIVLATRAEDSGATPANSRVRSRLSFSVQQVTFPIGGHLRWQYASQTYAQTTIREVATRYLLSDPAIGERTYSLAGTRNGAGSMDIARVLTDSTGKATKTWNLNDVGSASGGIVRSVSEGSGSQAPRVTSYSWAQNSAGNNYLSRLQTTLDSGTGNAVTRQMDQTVDAYGNLTQTKLYAFSDLTTPDRIYNSVYLSSATYTNLYIRNRRTSVTVTDKNGVTTTLKQNTYDQYPSGITATPNVQQQDAQGYGPSYTARGNIYDEGAPWGSWHHDYDQTGTLLWIGKDINPNQYVRQTTSTATNYAVPDVITTADSLNTNFGWTASLHSSATTGPNQDTTTVQYDSADRPHTVASPYGANTVFSYSTSAPQITATTNNHWVRTYLDGIGRPLQIQSGDNTATRSSTEIVYDAVGALPEGKAVRQSAPHLPGLPRIGKWTLTTRWVARRRAHGRTETRLTNTSTPATQRS